MSIEIKILFYSMFFPGGFTPLSKCSYLGKAHTSTMPSLFSHPHVILFHGSPQIQKIMVFKFIQVSIKNSLNSYYDEFATLTLNNCPL